jgi:hypothetical protein
MYSFYSSCVEWPSDDVNEEGGLISLIGDSRDITRKTFLSKVDKAELANIESNLGYVAHPKQGLTMAGDWHVRYFVSKLHGARVYGFVHSAIEFVFTEKSDD